MKQFFVIYRVPVATMDQWMSGTAPEERAEQGKKLGQDMQAWTERHKDAIVEGGWPLGKTKTVSKSGAVDGRNDLNYACIMQAESADAVAAMFADNPHIATIPDSTVDIMEIPHMGM
jgi:hypothetical protein